MTRKADGGGRTLACALVVVIVLGQRLAIPVGSSAQLSIEVPVVFGLVALGVLRGQVSADRRLLGIFGVVLVTLAALTAVSFARGQHPSLLSLALLPAIYLPTLFRLRSSAAVRAATRLFVDLMGVLGALGAVVFGLQYVGVRYVDYPALVVPDRFLVSDFVTSYPLVYGSSIFRANGVVFLEASFFSLFLGLALVISAASRYHRWWLPVFVVAMGCSLSGNGVVLTLASLVGMVLTNPRAALRTLGLPVLVASIAAVSTPLGDLLLSRVVEIRSPKSSAHARIIGPYESLVPQIVDSARSALLGHGAGSTEAYLEAHVLDADGNPPIITSAIPKLGFEFGVIGAAVTLIFIAALFWAGRRHPACLGLAVVYFVINASLLQPTLAVASFLFLTILRWDDVQRGLGVRGARSDRPHDARRRPDGPAASPS